MPLASSDVIGVKQVSIGRIWGSIAPDGRGQHEGLEKPTGMGQVPFGGTHIWHGLNDIIFGHQRLAEALGKLPHLLVTPDNWLVRGGFPMHGGDRRVVGSLSEGHVLLLFRGDFRRYAES